MPLGASLITYELIIVTKVGNYAAGFLYEIVLHHEEFGTGLPFAAMLMSDIQKFPNYSFEHGNICLI